MKKVPTRAKDLTGHTFNELTVLGFYGYYKLPCGKNKLQWLCRCSCGVIKPVLATTLRNTKVQSCGHHKSQITSKLFRKPLWEVVRNNTMHHYKANAKRMGRTFEIAEDLWFKMITSDCHYCGSPPSNAWEHRYSDEVFYYNGVDRVDNEQGYTLENTVSCCAPCNMMKRGMSVNDFLAHVKRISAFNDCPARP